MDFIILKVNGTDVSTYPHEDAVQMFLSAAEPIVVEVKRRPALVTVHESGDFVISPVAGTAVTTGSSSSGNCYHTAAVTGSTSHQTTIGSSSSSSSGGGLVSTAVQTDVTTESDLVWLAAAATGTTEEEMDNAEEEELLLEVEEEYEDGVVALEYFDHDIDLEEVTLRKCSSDEKIGLTVCYSSGSEQEAPTATEVYIRDIAPQSVADRDGRLRQGDQILQVNGKDVANKEETECLFAENRKAVTLLVSRCYARSEDNLDLQELTPERATYQNTLLEQITQSDSHRRINHTHHQKYNTTTSSAFHTTINNHQKLNLTNSLVRSKLDSINHEISELNQRMQNIHLTKPLLSSARRLAAPSVDCSITDISEHIYETIPESVDSEIEPIYSCPYEASGGVTGDKSIVVKWLKAQQQTQQQQNVGGDSWTMDSKDNKSRSQAVIATSAATTTTTTAVVVRSKSSSKSNSSHSAEEHENSSSAYNTGGSCNSNPLTFELAARTLKSEVCSGSTLVLCPLVQQKPPIAAAAAAPPSASAAKTKSTNGNGKWKTTSSSAPNIRSMPHQQQQQQQVLLSSDTMYTNVANLQQTMLLQQQLFRQALGQQSSDVAGGGRTTIASMTTSTSLPNQQSQDSTRMEWKVKRRPDGTRYIARRPIRNQILKNREMKINDERGGLTTEDDTISELKVGRYWTKEERRKHLEKSRERRQRQEILLASRHLEDTSNDNHLALDKGVVSGGGGMQQQQQQHCSVLCKKNANNLDNTARKQQKSATTNSGKKTHKDSESSKLAGGGKIAGLLSVTTV